MKISKPHGVFKVIRRKKIFNRLIPIEFVTTLAGVIAAIAKILVYIFLLIMLYNFNKLRTDDEKRRERENK